MIGTIGVEPITGETQPLLTNREHKAAVLRPRLLVVARRPGERPAVLASGRSWPRLSRVARELALAHGVECLSTPVFVAPEPEAGEQP